MIIDIDPNPDGIICLDDSYAYALIGHTISPAGLPRFCYSLSKLAKREAFNLNCGEDQAREAVFSLVQDITKDHGDRAPLFVDDNVSTEKEVRILGPGGLRIN